MSRKKLFFMVPALIMACLFSLSAARAQSPTQVIIIYPAAEAQADSMALSIFFTIIDQNGQPIPDPGIDDTAEIQLIGGNTTPIPAEVGDPQTPFYIAFLLDASGSMAGAMPSVHEAATAALENAPSTGRFGVFQFNELAIDEPMRPIEDFTDDMVLVQGGINAIQAEELAPTCLYNALYQTIELLDEATTEPQQRQAILLFTDGKDIRADGTPCSQRTFQDVINRAVRDVPSTPIHTIGLCDDAQCDNLKRQELIDMAKETFAFSAIGSKEQLGELFKQIMEGLSSQRVARANVYPRQGENDAVLRVKLGDGGALTASFKFFADKDYAAPLPDPTIQITRLSYDEVKDVYHLSLGIANPQSIQNVFVQVWDTKRGQIPPDHPIDLAKAGDIELKPDGFENGHEYSFRVLATDHQGNLFPGKEGKPFLVESEPVTYEPNVETTIKFLIESVTPDYTANKLTINLADIPDESRIDKYEGVILDEKNNEVAKFGPDVYQVDQGRRIEIELPAAIRQIQAETGYQITITLLDKDDQPSKAATAFKASPPAQLGFFARTWLALRDNPIITFSIIIIIFCVAIMFIYWNRPARKEKLQPPLPRPPIDQTLVAPVASMPGPPPQPKSQPPRPARLRLKVLLSPSPPPSKETVITTFPFVIGRNGCDFNIPDQRISRRHVEITNQNGKFFITDLDSRNGTFIGDMKLPPHQPTPVNNSTVVQVGQQTQLQLEPV
jgi:hypothetical protein